MWGHCRTLCHNYVLIIIITVSHVYTCHNNIIYYYTGGYTLLILEFNYYDTLETKGVVLAIQVYIIE